MLCQGKDHVLRIPVHRWHSHSHTPQILATTSHSDCRIPETKPTSHSQISAGQSPGCINLKHQRTRALDRLPVGNAWSSNLAALCRTGPGQYLEHGIGTVNFKPTGALAHSSLLSALYTLPSTHAVCIQECRCDTAGRHHVTQQSKQSATIHVHVDEEASTRSEHDVLAILHTADRHHTPRAAR